VTSPLSLKPGLSRLGFTGRRGVDIDVYILSHETQQALIGNWGETAWGGHVTHTEERQHLLRVRGAGSFTTVILPWRKGKKPDGLSVASKGDTILIKSVDLMASIATNGYEVTQSGKTTRRVF